MIFLKTSCKRLPYSLKIPYLHLFFSWGSHLIKYLALKNKQKKRQFNQTILLAFFWREYFFPPCFSKISRSTTYIDLDRGRATREEWRLVRLVNCTVVHVSRSTASRPSARRRRHSAVPSPVRRFVGARQAALQSKSM